MLDADRDAGVLGPVVAVGLADAGGKHRLRRQDVAGTDLDQVRRDPVLALELPEYVGDEDEIVGQRLAVTAAAYRGSCDRAFMPST